MIGKNVQMRRFDAEVIATPDYILCDDGEMVARIRRTGVYVIVRRSGRTVGCGRVSVDVFAVDTVVRQIDGRPSCVGVRGARIGAGRV